MNLTRIVKIRVYLSRVNFVERFSATLIKCSVNFRALNFQLSRVNFQYLNFMER